MSSTTTTPVVVSLNPEAPNFEDLLANSTDSISTTQRRFFSLLVNDCCKNLGSWMQLQVQKARLDELFSSEQLLSAVNNSTNEESLSSASSIEDLYNTIADLALSNELIARAMAVILSCVEQAYHWPVIPRAFPSPYNLTNIKFIVHHALFVELKERISENKSNTSFAQLAIKSADDIFETLNRFSTPSSPTSTPPSCSSTSPPSTSSSSIFPPIVDREQAQFLTNLLFRNIRHDVFYQQASYKPNRRLMEFGNLHEISRTNGMMREINEIFEECGGVSALKEVLVLLEEKQSAFNLQQQKEYDTVANNLDKINKDTSPHHHQVQLSFQEENAILNFCNTMQNIIVRMNSVMVNTRWDLSVWAATFLRYCKPIAPGTLGATGVDTAAFHFIDALIINYASVVEQHGGGGDKNTSSNNNKNKQPASVPQQKKTAKSGGEKADAESESDETVSSAVPSTTSITTGDSSSSSSSTSSSSGEEQKEKKSNNASNSGKKESGKESLIRLHEERAKYFPPDMRAFIHRLHALSTTSDSIFSLRSVIKQHSAQSPRLENAFTAVCQQYHQLLEMHRKMSPGIVTALRSSGAIRQTSGGFTNRVNNDENAASVHDREQYEAQNFSKPAPTTIAEVDMMMSAEVNLALNESMETRFGVDNSASSSDSSSVAAASFDQINKKIAPPALRATFQVVECTIPEVEQNSDLFISASPSCASLSSCRASMNDLFGAAFGSSGTVPSSPGPAPNLMQSPTGSTYSSPTMTPNSKARFSSSAAPSVENAIVQINFDEDAEIYCQEGDRLLLSLTGQPKDERVFTITKKISPSQFQIAVKNAKSSLTAMLCALQSDSHVFVRVGPAIKNHFSKLLSIDEKKKSKNYEDFLGVYIGQGNAAVSMIEHVHSNMNKQQESMLICCSRDWRSIPLKSRLLEILSNNNNDHEHDDSEKKIIINVVLVLSKPGSKDEEAITQFFSNCEKKPHVHAGGRINSFFNHPETKSTFFAQNKKLNGFVTGGADFGIMIAKSLISSGIVSPSSSNSSNNTQVMRCGPMDLSVFPREPSFRYDVYNYIPLPKDPSSLPSQFTLRDLALRNIISAKEGSAWIAVDGFVYDISCLLPLHPGGLKQLTPCLGLDASKTYQLIHGRSAFSSGEATAMLRACLIGGLKDEMELLNSDNNNNNDANNAKQASLKFLEAAISDWVTIQNTATNSGQTYKWPSLKAIEEKSQQQEQEQHKKEDAVTAKITETPPTFLLTNGLHQFVLNIQDWAMKFMPFSQQCNLAAEKLTSLTKDEFIEKTILKNFCELSTEKPHAEKLVTVYENISLLWNRIHDETFDEFKKFMCCEISINDESFGICACEEAFEKFLAKSQEIVSEFIENKELW